LRSFGVRPPVATIIDRDRRPYLPCPPRTGQHRHGGLTGHRLVQDQV